MVRVAREGDRTGGAVDAESRVVVHRLEAVEGAAAGHVRRVGAGGRVDHLARAAVLIDGQRRIARRDRRGHLVQVVDQHAHRLLAGVAGRVGGNQNEAVAALAQVKINNAVAQADCAGLRIHHQQIGVVVASQQAVGDIAVVAGLGRVDRCARHLVLVNRDLRRALNDRRTCIEVDIQRLACCRGVAGCVNLAHRHRVAARTQRGFGVVGQLTIDRQQHARTLLAGHLHLAQARQAVVGTDTGVVQQRQLGCERRDGVHRHRVLQHRRVASRVADPHGHGNSGRADGGQLGRADPGGPAAVALDDARNARGRADVNDHRAAFAARAAEHKTALVLGQVDGAVAGHRIEREHRRGAVQHQRGLRRRGGVARRVLAGDLNRHLAFGQGLHVGGEQRQRPGALRHGHRAGQIAHRDREQLAVFQAVG